MFGSKASRYDATNWLPIDGMCNWIIDIGQQVE